MELNGESKLLRIFIGESDKIHHKPLYEAILFAAHKKGLAGCTVIRGLMSFGASTAVQSAKLIETSPDLPVVIEIIDFENKINQFVPEAGQLLEQSGCGGMITIEKADVLYYKSKRKK